MGIKLDLHGKKFGRLAVVEQAPRRPADRNVMWTCQCDCGEVVIVAASNLAHGDTQSCGCLQRESVSERFKGNTTNRTHNMSHSTEYSTWSAMRARCNNQRNHKYPSYGARGIKVCERWDSFEAFYADMGPKPEKGMSIERLNNNGNYEPGNCIWATPQIQANNRRPTKFIEINGQRLNVKQWIVALRLKPWQVYELLRPTGRERNGPPKFGTVEEAVRYWYDRVHSS